MRKRKKKRKSGCARKKRWNRLLIEGGGDPNHGMGKGKKKKKEGVCPWTGEKR